MGNRKTTNVQQQAGQARGIDRVLALASRPELPPGAIDRLMARIETAPAANVMAFKPRPPALNRLFRYAAAVPLAASLALGIYLGAVGALDFALPAAVTGDVASAEDTADDLGGVGEAEEYAEENLS